MKRLIPGLAAIALLCLVAGNTAAQAIVQDSVKFNYPKIYSLCLDANVSPALAMIRADESKPMTPRDRDFKARFESRFGFDEDKSGYLAGKKSTLDSLLAIFHTYWRVSLLDTSKNNDSLLLSRLNVFLHNNRLPAHNEAVNTDSLGAAVKKHIESRGFHTTDGIGKTGRLYDLLVWKTEKDSTYIFRMGREKIKARVIMMDGFLTLGWEEYATMGKLYPGGWTTTTALYCVKSAYVLNS
ncbi:MAG TPA: hypothetical protein VLD19_02855, partial [Chitinophagaceae bacterium]|nr:hypothetical protein [Chitinophagaceae bacterium]